MLRDSLVGTRVLDFTQIGAGPTCTMFLGDLGANIIKVEPPEGDVGRKLGPPWYHGHSPIFIAFNRSKRSISIDLKAPRGREVALDLAKRADVIVESFRPGVMNRLGLGYDALKRSNPSLIYCSISGFGQSGPLANRPGVDGILQAASGLMGLIGLEGLEPCKVQVPIVDVGTGYIATIGVLAQILQNKVTGQGGYLDVNLFASSIALQQSAITTYMADQKQPKRIGSAAPYSAPNEAFQTKDGWLMVSAYIGDRWKRLCHILGCAELIHDPRFATSGDRITNRQEMKILLDAVFKKRTTASWLKELISEDILCSEIADYVDVLKNPQLDYLKMFTGIEHPDFGQFVMPGFPINSHDHASRDYLPPPGLGEHTREILGELNYSSDDIEKLLVSGIAFIKTNAHAQAVD